MSSPLVLYKQLPKTNCGKCNIPSCMAFAALVMQGKVKLQECPYAGEDLIQQFEVSPGEHLSIEKEQLKIIKILEKKISEMDFDGSALRLGGKMSGNKIIISCLGRNFFFDKNGNLSSDCHTHAWIRAMMLSYFVSCKGAPQTGRWVLFRELKGGNDWFPFFSHRCITPLKSMADNDFDLFSKILGLFGEQYDKYEVPADLSIVMYPLPRVPVLIKYVKEEGEFESVINIFFDASATENINIEAIYNLGAGITIMFDKFMKTHGRLDRL